MFLATARFGANEFQENIVSDIGDLRRKERIVLQTSRGTEVGRVETPPAPMPRGSNFPHFARVIRRATDEDLSQQKDLEFEKRITAHKRCLELIEQHKLKMRLVYVELLLGNEKAFFYFISDQRIDFRDLVKDLAKDFHTRIELRQIGEREAARFLGDYQSCGQKLCCKTFLKKLPPVSMSMARNQLTTLDPGKLAGQCGKLKCCLRYEDNVYTELKKNLPDRGTLVITDGVQGEVIGLDIYNQKVTLVTQDGPRVHVAAEEIKEVKQGGLKILPPKPQDDSGESGRRSAQRPPGYIQRPPRGRGPQGPQNPGGPGGQEGPGGSQGGQDGPSGGPSGGSPGGKGGPSGGQGGGPATRPNRPQGPRPQGGQGQPGGPRGPRPDGGQRRPQPPRPAPPPAGGNPAMNMEIEPAAVEEPSSLLVDLLRLRSAPAAEKIAPAEAPASSCSTGGCGSGGCSSGGCSSGGCGTKKVRKPPPSLEDFYRLLVPSFSRA